MRVSVLINSKAGSVNEDLIRHKIREALFRCDLQIFIPQSIDDTNQFISDELEAGTDALIVCGGDGTINKVLQVLMARRAQGKSVAPLCIVCSGTANDLGSELNVSRRVDRAAREIFEGAIRRVDVLKISSDKGVSYMLTNGGLGISESAARSVNGIREKLRTTSVDEQNPRWMRLAAGLGLSGIHNLKAHIYELLFLQSLRDWQNEGWSLEITIDDLKLFQTEAPLIMVNNQSRLGQHFVPAPFTMNDDGTFDLLLINQKSKVKLIQLVRKLQSGSEPTKDCKHYEVRKVRVRSLNPDRQISFFGDGEILQDLVQECTIECVQPGLEIFAQGDGGIR